MAASEREERGGAISYRGAEIFQFGDMNIAREATKRRAHLYCTADIPIECQKVTFQPISGFLSATKRIECCSGLWRGSAV